jgi:hypothetical protein
LASETKTPSFPEFERKLLRLGELQNKVNLGIASSEEKIELDRLSKSAEETAHKCVTKVERITKNILEHGDVLKFLVQQAQRNHIGDTDVIKHLLASIASTNSLTSAGIQPELNGEKGHGKTDAVKAVFHLIPDKWKLAASISAKALYYHSLAAGSIIFSDDVEWSPDLIATVKRSMGDFQNPQTHFTLDKNRNPLPHSMPARLVWWLSSVESVADDQLKDRQYSLDIDDSVDHAKKVSSYLRKSRAQKIMRFSVDWRFEVARCIIEKIKSHEPFKVVIDCAEAADWKVHGDHRTQNKFWDLVEAFAILRYKQRHIDEDGWLHATIEDFNEAKTIFMRRKVNHATHLTNAQTKIVKSISALQKEVEGATQARIAEDLGISYQAVQKGLNAIEANTRYIVHEKGVNGVKFYRCTVSSLEFSYNEGDLVSLPEGYEDPYNPIQPRYNQDTTIHTTNLINDIKCNIIDIQPNEVVHSNGKGELSKNSKYSSSQKIGCKGYIESHDGDNEVVSEVVSRLNRQHAMVVTRFLEDVSSFVGIDDLVYGPFLKEDVASIPSIHAAGLVAKGICLEVRESVS